MTDTVPTLTGAPSTFLGMGPQQWVFLIAIAALNIFVVWALRQVSLKISLSEILAEKGPTEVAARANAVQVALNRRLALAKDNPPAGTGNNPPAPDPKTHVEPAIPDPIPTSYSRTSGFLGSLILVAALWAFANYAVWAAFWQPKILPGTLDSLKSFFLAGSALFAPYAFNRLGTMFTQK